MRISDWSSDVCSSDLVSVRKLNLGHFATKQEIIEIELGANGAAALYLNVEEGAPIRIDAAGLIHIVQDTVHAGAGVGPRPVAKTANKNPAGLSGRRTRTAERQVGKD